MNVYKGRLLKKSSNRKSKLVLWKTQLGASRYHCHLWPWQWHTLTALARKRRWAAIGSSGQPELLKTWAAERKVQKKAEHRIGILQFKLLSTWWPHLLDVMPLGHQTGKISDWIHFYCLRLSRQFVSSRVLDVWCYLCLLSKKTFPTWFWIFVID